MLRKCGRSPFIQKPQFKKSIFKSNILFQASKWFFFKAEHLDYDKLDFEAMEEKQVRIKKTFFSSNPPPPSLFIIFTLKFISANKIFKYLWFYTWLQKRVGADISRKYTPLVFNFRIKMMMRMRVRMRMLSD